MIFNRLKKIFIRCLEGVIAVLLVLIFFSIILQLLNELFPTGTSLKALISNPDITASSGLSKLGISQNRDGFFSEQSSENTQAAVLSWMRNKVKSKSSQAIAWKNAKEGKLLYDRDAIQTLSRSAAEIEFDENSTLSMGANSLVIIKRMDHDPLYREKRSFMVLVDGDLRGQMAGSSQDSVYLEVATPGATIRTQSGPQAEGPVDFKISINPDQSSTITVYEGSAEVNAQGETVVVEANQATIVALNQTPQRPGLLPDPVNLKSPSGQSVYYYRDLPPKIRFAWQSTSAAAHYHFLLSRDASFYDIITDERFSDNGLSHGNLKKGTYYWKVSALVDSVEGNFSGIRQFRVVQDQTPPILKVRFPPGMLFSGRYTLRGKTEPGARVFVGGKRVKTTRKGKFEHSLKLQPGMNVIVVEAVDAVDNVAYRSQRVICKY
jgi:hypothetical protein